MPPADSAPPPATTSLPPLASLSIDRAAAGVRRRRPLWARWWFWLIVLVAAVAVAAVIMQSRSALAVEMTSVVTVYPSQALSVLNATGRVSARTRASVASKATGRLEWLGVVEGQRVKEGETIARLENRDVAAQREQATAQVLAARANLEQGEAEVVNAEADLKRAQDLLAQKFVSPSAVDQAQARYTKARAVTAQLRAQIGVAQANERVAAVSLDQTLIRAPFTGIVLTKSANVGDIVTPFSSAAGTTGAVVTMADMATLEVEADVSENAIAKVSVGQPAEIQLDAFTELRLPGTVSRIVPTVDRSKATLLVKVSFEAIDPRVLPDMSAKVAFLSRQPTAADRQPVTAVRPEAITTRDGKEVIFVVAPAAVPTGADTKTDAAKDDAKPETVTAGLTRIQAVTRGQKIGDLVRIDGLAAGTRVVLNPPPKLLDGKAVTELKK